VAAVRRIVPLAACVALLWVPAGAEAQKCIARPGTAALDQYCETVPTDRGDTPARTTDRSLRATLSHDEVQKLERHEDGGAVLALPAGSGPKPPSTGSEAGGRPAPSSSSPNETAAQSAPAAATDAPPDAPSSNPFSAAFTALGGVGALGWGIVVALVVAAAAAAAGTVGSRYAATRE
jgi:hypothetical protein